MMTEDDRNSLDSLTPIGRWERYRRAGAAAIGNIGAKGASALGTLVSVHLVSRYLGRELFGVWMIISSLPALLAFSDFGMGNGLLNAIAMAQGKGDHRLAQQAIASGFLVLTIAALAFLGVSLSLVWLVNWRYVFKLMGPESSAMIRSALAAFCISAGLAIPSSVTAKVQLGLQRGLRPAIWQSLGSLLGLALLDIAVKSGAAFPWLVGAFLIGPVIAAATNGLLFFGTWRSFAPRLRFISWGHVRWIGKLGAMFFVVQAVSAIAYSSDNIIAARFDGASAVGDYAVAASMFAISGSLLSAVILPLWPAYGEAMGRGDAEWVSKTLTHSTGFALVASSLAVICIALMFDRLSLIWVHRVLALPRTLLIGLGVWAIVQSIGNSIAMFLNGAHIVRLQMMLAIPFAIACVCVKIVLVPRIGLVGLPWATILTYVPISLLPALFVTRKLIWRLQRQSAGVSCGSN